MPEAHKVVVEAGAIFLECGCVEDEDEEEDDRMVFDKTERGEDGRESCVGRHCVAGECCSAL